MPPAGFEGAITASERPQTHALDRAATGIGIYTVTWGKFVYCKVVGMLDCKENMNSQKNI